MKTRQFILMALISFICIGAAAQQGETSKSILDRITVKGFGMLGYDHVISKHHDMGTFHVRLAEVMVNGKITDKWSFGITSQINTPMQLKDLYMSYSASEYFNFRVGQFKTPFTLENQVAPFLSNLVQGASYSAIYFNGINIDPLFFGCAGRDIGIEMNGKFFVDNLTYRLMLMNGQGINNRITTHPRTVAASLNYRLNDKLDIYGSVMQGRRTSQGEAFGIKVGEEYDRSRASIAVRGEYHPVRFMGEWIVGKDHKTTGLGYYLTTAVTVAPKVEVIGALDGYTRDTEAKDLRGSFYLGVQYWFYGKCRLQMQYRLTSTFTGYTSHVTDSNEHGLLAQAQFVF